MNVRVLVFYTGLASESALACPAAGAASFKEESQNLSCCVDGSPRRAHEPTLQAVCSTAIFESLQASSLNDSWRHGG